MMDLDLSRRAMAAGFKPVPGCLMLWQMGAREPVTGWRMTQRGCWDSDAGWTAIDPPPEWVIGPDINDPTGCTLGALVAQVREGAGGRRCMISWPTPEDEPGGPWPAGVEVWLPSRGIMRAFCSPTLAEALVAALEARHDR